MAMRTHNGTLRAAGSVPVLGVVMLLAADAGADEREIPSAFVISKTQNRNQVHYAVKVDEACRPVTAAPVRPYWLMLTKGPQVTEPLLDREQPAYGLARQQVEGSAVRLVLRALPGRPVLIQTWQGPDGACLSAAVTTIAGSRARLFNVHVACALLCTGVDHLVLTGWRDDGTVVHELVKR
jgi:hypothetical protein